MRRAFRLACIAVPAALALAACDEAPSLTHYVLALSWQPAFCELSAERPECGALDPADFAASNLTVHGLWPNDRPGGGPSYCEVDDRTKDLDESGDWCALPAPQLSAKTRDALATAMPGTASCLDRHEWIKHGTCADARAEDYFADSLRLAQAVQATRLGQVIAGNIGRHVTSQQLRNAFEAAFGAGSSKALTLVCRERNGRHFLTEIRIALEESALGGALDRNDLYLEGEARPGSCPEDMWVDAAG
jgi:ribonuclease T2